MTVTLLSNLAFYIPELIAIITMCALLFMESAYGDHERRRTFVYVTGVIGLSLCLFSLFKNIPVESISIFAGSVVVDSFSTLMKITMVIGTLGTFYISHKSIDIYEEFKSEYLIMAVGVLVGGMLLASSNNLLTLYLGVETLSILSYVMTSLKRRDSHSSEAGIKYALYGGITAGVMLFGMSHLYGIFGSIQFGEIVNGMKAMQEFNIAVIISMLMFFVGIGYKIACFPFHMWSPDVYQGSPAPVTAFFAIVPKIAGIAVVARVTYQFFGAENVNTEMWMRLIQIIAALTMTVGNLSALNQKSVKRMLAFSSIGHVGLILMGVITFGEQGMGAILFYTLVYTFMTLGAFFVTTMVINRTGSDDAVYFKGLAKTHPILGFSMTIILFSLAGMPPFGGFIAKFNIIMAAVDKGLLTLALIAAINSVISLVYYLKLARTMILEDADGEQKIDSYSLTSRVYIIAMVIPIIFLGLFWNNIYNLYSSAKIYLN